MLTLKMNFYLFFRLRELQELHGNMIFSCIILWKELYLWFPEYAFLLARILDVFQNFGFGIDFSASVC